MIKINYKLYKNLVYCDFFISKKKNNGLSSLINNYNLFNLYETIKYIKQLIIIVNYIKQKMKKKLIIIQLNNQFFYNFSQAITKYQKYNIKYINNNILNYLKLNNYYNKISLFCSFNSINLFSDYQIRQNNKLFFSNIELISQIDTKTIVNDSLYNLPINVNNLKKYIFFYILLNKYSVTKSNL